MAYIEAHQSLLTHRKTLRLGRLLGMDRFCVVGRLLALWCWALDNAPDGFVEIADSDILADVMGWEGEPAALCDALVQAGFLEVAEGSYLIHDWYDYAGRLIERRQQNAERMRNARAAKPRGDADTRSSHVQRTFTARAGATVPNRTVPESNDPSGFVAAAPSPDGPALSLVASGAEDAPGEPVKETKPDKSVPKPRAMFGGESDAMQLAVAFADGLRRNKPDVKLPRDLQPWAREFDLMLRVDRRPREKIEAVIAYALASTFWRRVVLSASKLREKFDTLDLQRMEDATDGKHGRSLGSARRGDGKPAVGTPEYYEAARRRQEEYARANANAWA